MSNDKPVIIGRIPIEQQNEIIELTGKMDRPEIADKIGISKRTVYNYQKKFNIS